jgi:heterodisulfide reductase subunit A-like polyferredoxin
MVRTPRSLRHQRVDRAQIEPDIQSHRGARAVPMAGSREDTERLTCDVLIVGGGVAALRAAVAACEAGGDVLLCCKGIAGRSGNTVVSTADISAYIAELGADD